MELFFDTETSDKFNFKTQNYKSKGFPWIVQLAAVLAEDGIAYAELNVLIKPKGRTICDEAARVHQIDTETAERFGIEEEAVALVFNEMSKNADILVAHNFNFDSQMVAALFNNNLSLLLAEELLHKRKSYCTMKETTELCKIPGKYGNKWPKLQELHNYLFKEDFVGAHDAMFDIRATMKCFYELRKIGWIK